MKGIYIVGGYPNLNDFKKQIEIINNINIDFIEIGIPFNDPVADGPVIAKAINETVNHNYSVDEILEIAQQTDKPFYIMTYANIIYKYGAEKFSEKYGNVIKGLIIADLPNRLHKYFYNLGLKIPIIPFVTVETREEDFELIKKLKGDFIYFIGTRGTTGVKVDFNSKLLKDRAIEIRNRLNKKFIIGFGIKNREDYMKVLEYADGFVIGTEIVKKQDNLREFEIFLKSLF